jgi:hypothetical protein
MAFFYINARGCSNPLLFFNPNTPNTPNCVDVCPVYLYGNTATRQCEPCLLGCWTCSEPTTCHTCNPLDFRTLDNNVCPCNLGYYPNPSGSPTCVLCSTQLADCATCVQSSTGSFTCLTCASGFVFTGTSCISCNINMCLAYTFNGTGCLCTSCQTGTALFGSPLGLSCGTCSKTNCLSVAFVLNVCSCTQCDVGYTISGSDCVPCSTSMPQCLQCSDQSTCTLCNDSNLYWLNGTSKC